MIDNHGTALLQLCFEARASGLIDHDGVAARPCDGNERAAGWVFEGDAQLRTCTRKYIDPAELHPRLWSIFAEQTRFAAAWRQRPTLAENDVAGDLTLGAGF
jgi:hypothetical protein